MRSLLLAFGLTALALGAAATVQARADEPPSPSPALPPSLDDAISRDSTGDPVEGRSTTDAVMARALRSAVLEDWDSALDYAQTAAGGGEPAGALLAGHILLHGLSERGQDDEAAVRWLRRAGETGDADALVILSRLASSSRGGLNAFQAEDFLARAAETGDARAAQEFGLYLMDRSDPGAAGAALDWLRLAAESGRVSAYSDYAYALGEWVHGPHDLSAMRAWYERAGENGEAHGALMAAAMHLNGEGEGADAARGVSLMRIAAELGQPAAMGQLALLYFQGGPNLAANPSRAADWARRGAEAGDGESQFLYAYALATGDGTARDLERAYVWVLRAGFDRPGSLMDDPDRDRLEAALETALPPARRDALEVEAITGAVLGG
ncbi:tetratricopeptide repeat protein [Maricaulaceae bacterium MS644]